MVAERYWKQQRDAVMAEVRAAASNDEVLNIYRRFWEGLKVQVLSSYGHADVLRQQIALLFIEAAQGAEMLLVRSEPALTVVQTAQAPEEKWQRILRDPRVIYGLVGLGVVMSVIAGGDAWRCILPLAGIAAVQYVNDGRKTRRPEHQYTVYAPILADAFEKQVTQQVRMIDAHVADLQALQDDVISPVSDLPMDKDTLTACQYVWANANQGYPTESTLHVVEKLLHQNDLEWVAYTPDAQRCFDVMPTRKQGRMMYPALRKVSDGTLVCKGQYLQQM